MEATGTIACALFQQNAVVCLNLQTGDRCVIDVKKPWSCSVAHSLLAIAAYGNGAVTVYNLSGELVHKYKHSCWVYTVKFFNTKPWIASGDCSGTIKIYDLTSNQQYAEYHVHKRVIRSITISPDDWEIAAASDDGHASAAQVDNVKGAVKLSGHGQEVKCVLFLPQQVCLTGSADCKIKVWNMTTGQCTQTLQQHTETVTCLARSAAGDVLASASEDKTIVIWDAATLTPLRTIRCKNTVNSLAFLNDGLTLLAGVCKCGLIAYSYATGQELRKLDVPVHGSVFGLNYDGDAGVSYLMEMQLMDIPFIPV